MYRLHSSSETDVDMDYSSNSDEVSVSRSIPNTHSAKRYVKYNFNKNTFRNNCSYMGQPAHKYSAIHGLSTNGVESVFNIE